MKSNKAFWVLFLLIGCLLLAACANPGPDRRQRAKALRDLGREFLENRPRDALRELLESLKINPKDPETHNLLALTYERLDRLDLATRHFKKALQLKPNYSEARNNMAVVLMKQNKWNAAIAQLMTISEDLLYPTPQIVDVNLGWAHFNLGQHDAASQAYRRTLDYYEKGLPQDNTYIIALVGMGRTMLALEETSAAVAHLNKAAVLVPNNPEIQYELGRAHAAAGNHATARQAFQKVMQLAPRTDLARKARTAADGL